MLTWHIFFAPKYLNENKELCNQFIFFANSCLQMIITSITCESSTKQRDTQMTNAKINQVVNKVNLAIAKAQLVSFVLATRKDKQAVI